MIPVYFLLKILAHKFKARKLKVILEYLSIWLFFNFIIRVFLESYIDFALTALLNLKRMNWKIDGESLSSGFSFVVSFLLILFSIFVYYFLFKNGQLIVEK